MKIAFSTGSLYTCSLERLKDRFQGTVTVELNPVSLELEDERQVRAHLKATVEFCRRHIG